MKSDIRDYIHRLHQTGEILNLYTSSAEALFSLAAG